MKVDEAAKEWTKKLAELSGMWSKQTGADGANGDGGDGDDGDGGDGGDGDGDGGDGDVWVGCHRWEYC